MNNKRISEILKVWGKKNQKLPKDNDLYKQNILSRISFSVPGYRKINNKRNSLPWLSMTFGAMAVVTLLIGVVPRFSLNTFSTSSFSLNQVGVMEEGSRMLIPDYFNSGKTTSDTREFLKTSYSATIQTRNVGEMLEKVEYSIRLFGGRIDYLNDREKSGNISFSIPVSQFDMFKREIKSLTNARLFVDGQNSTNLLSQKQNIEARQRDIEKTLINLKKDSTQLSNSYSQTISAYAKRINNLDVELKLLQVELPNASYDRKAEINSRINRIFQERNILESELENERKIYLSKLNNINKQLKNTESSLVGIKEQDQNLLENVSMVNGNIAFKWISLWKLIDLFAPGPLLAWIFVFAALISYWRYRVFMRVFI
jgi:hypothetical protein